MRVGLIVAVTTAVLTGAADAKPSMREVPEIENMLFTVAIANEKMTSPPLAEANTAYMAASATTTL